MGILTPMKMYGGTTIFEKHGTGGSTVERIQQIELEISRTQKNKVLDMAWDRRSWNYCTDCGAASYFIGTVLSDTFSISSVWMQFFDIFWYVDTYGPMAPSRLLFLLMLLVPSGTPFIFALADVPRQQPNILESESPQLLEVEIRLGKSWGIFQVFD